MRDLDLTTLRLFVAVCETRNMARAGEQEHIVASAISKRLAQLRKRWAPRCWNAAAAVIPTPAGEIVLAHARHAGRRRPRGATWPTTAPACAAVRLLATTSSLAESLPDDIAAFLRQPEHRDIGVTIEESLSTEIVRSLREGSAPLGICWDAADRRASRPGPTAATTAVVVPATHPLARLEACRFEDTLAFDRRHAGADGRADHAGAARRHPRPAHRLPCRGVHLRGRAALRAGRTGHRRLPGGNRAAGRAGAGLCIIPLRDGWARRRFAICFRDVALLSPAAQLLVGFLERSAAAAPDPVREPAGIGPADAADAADAAGAAGASARGRRVRRAKAGSAPPAGARRCAQRAAARMPGTASVKAAMRCATCCSRSRWGTWRVSGISSICAGPPAGA